MPPNEPENGSYPLPSRRPEPADATLLQELWASTEMLFQSKLNWLLVLGPLALVGDATGMLGEPICFAFSGLALIPCAERLSFVTEQVAAHTNGTIGALLNATFGNAPELLISTAALRAGFYRVVQLAMLGSMLTNLLFVFGLSCLVGGARWQVQELRITSGNVSVGMLLAATAGCLLPAALALSGEMRSHPSYDSIPSKDELTFCRVNAAVMMIMYLCYLTFQLGTHKDEFEDDNIMESGEQAMFQSPTRHIRKGTARRNMFCLRYLSRRHQPLAPEEPLNEALVDVEMTRNSRYSETNVMNGDHSSLSSGSHDGGDEPPIWSTSANLGETASLHSRSSSRRRRAKASPKSRVRSYDENDGIMREAVEPPFKIVSPMPFVDRKSIFCKDKSRNSDRPDVFIEEEDCSHGAQMSFRTGIVWLFIITLCISAMSDILVDTIDGFAYRCRISEVFTSMVIIPFFSNVAEQVSAVLFAYRNEMDLCVGVTVGSAIQIALFVLPGCVLVGMLVDRSMTLYFRGYETCCLFFGVICAAAVLQGGTTNWLVGMTLIGIYIMIAAGFWFHELEDLSTDAEIAIQNKTTRILESIIFN